jgi:hypothetical protein
MTAMAQTNVSGGIYSNTTFSLANSPYIVVDHLVLFPNVTLTIEPGVELKFDAWKYLEVRGELISIGTPASRITYTSNAVNPSKSDWAGIKVMNSLGAKASFEYNDFKYAYTSNEAECCYQGGPIYYNHCKFHENHAGIGGYTGFDINIDNSEFTNNIYAVVNADKVIRNSIFTNNEYGLYQSERIDIYNSTFNNNGTALFGGRGIIQNSIITNNTIGVNSFFEGFEIRNSIISNNGTGILAASNNGFVPTIVDNEICNNTTYNVENLDNLNKDLRNNCWCTDVEADIEDKLKDGYDDLNLGVFNYSIYDDSCNFIVREVIKDPSLSTDELISILEQAVVYPNPASSEINIQIDKEIEALAISIFDVTGKWIFTTDYKNVELIKLNINSLNKGNYILKIISSGKEVTKKVVKM